MGCRTLMVFKGAGSLTRHSLFPLADSDPSFLRARRVAGSKTRTLHKNREGCGTPIWVADQFARMQVFRGLALIAVSAGTPGKLTRQRILDESCSDLRCGI
jgi:hypothetical protein